MVVQKKKSKLPPIEWGPKAFAGFSEYRHGKTNKRAEPRLAELSIAKTKKRTVWPVTANSYHPNGSKGEAAFRPRLDQPVTLHHPVVKDANLEKVVARIAEALRDGESNPWEREASTLEGLRSTILQEHWNFAEAEAEAIDLIRRAYNLLGRGIERRPAWHEGQRKATIARENCAKCGNPLPDHLAAGVRFCDDHCRMMSRIYDNAIYHWIRRLEYAHARTNLIRETGPLRDCDRDQCEKQFRSPDKKQRFCSPYCAGKAKGENQYTEHKCERPGCTRTFINKHGAKRAARFCSLKCRDEFKASHLPHRQCACGCGRQFQMKNDRHFFFERKCMRRAKTGKTHA